MTGSFQALGTTWWIELFTELPDERRAVVFDDCAAFAHSFEDKYSRFKADSLVSILNHERILERPSDEYRTLLAFGKQLFLRTSEKFNILSGHILEARGYDADYSFTDSDSTSLTPGNPITDLSITSERIELVHGNVDLGGFGKGYLIDRLAEHLRETHDIPYFLINGGGDMFATSNHDEPVPIHLEHPTKELTAIGQTTLQEQGFAASSPHRRAWKTAAGVSTHIVGELHLDAVFVTAPSAAEADAFATTALSLSDAERTQLFTTERTMQHLPYRLPRST